MSEGGAGGTGKIEIPEPRRTGDSASAPVGDDDLTARAFPFDSGGSIVRWIRRHVVEMVLFCAVIAILTAGALVLMRDPGPSATRDVVSVGPSPGQQVEPYVAVRKRALDDAAAKGGERVAVVTFDRRLTTQEFEALGVGGSADVVGAIVGVSAREVEVLQPAPSVEQSVARWTASQQERYEAQLAGAEEQLAASPSPTPIADWYQGQKRSSQQALDRLNAGTVIEGALLRGGVKNLAAIQQKPGVALVDLAPEGKRPDEVIPVMAGGAGS